MLVDDYDSAFRYKYDGGSLSADSPTYIVRQADFNLYHALKNKEYCYIFNARQMGKSSLRKHIICQLKAENFTCCTIDMSLICGNEISEQEFYQNFFYLLEKNLKLNPSEENYQTWEKQQNTLSFSQQFIELVDQVILQQIQNPVIIFFDEIDSLLTLPFPSDSFLQVIRNLYDRRFSAKGNHWHRLSFVFVGVTTPSDLINDPHYAPFNIGRFIELGDFELTECQPLEKGLTPFVEDPHTVIKTILSWTGGQPFLTQKLCWLVTQNLPIYKGKEATKIKKIVLEKIVENWELTESPEHLKIIRDRVLWQFHYSVTVSAASNSWQQLFRIRQSESPPYPPPSTEILSWYLLILKRGHLIYSEGDRAQKYLLMSGLVRLQNNRLIIKNKIYRLIFTEAWVKRQLQSLQREADLPKGLLLGFGEMMA